MNLEALWRARSISCLKVDLEAERCYLTLFLLIFIELKVWLKVVELPNEVTVLWPNCSYLCGKSDIYFLIPTPINIGFPNDLFLFSNSGI